MGIRQVIDCDGCINKDIQIGSYLGFHVGFIYGGPETERDYEELYLCSGCTKRLSSEIGEKIMEIKLLPYIARQTVCKGKGFPETNKIVRLIRESKVHQSRSKSKEIKNYLIDIDGTITEDIPNEEPERMVDCLPFPDALETLNRWYDEGHKITFFTSRTEAMREITETWLNKNGFKYHGLLMGKPRSNGGTYHWIDNINGNYEKFENWNKIKG